MIMDAVNLTKDAPEKNEAMQAAIDNDQIKNVQTNDKGEYRFDNIDKGIEF